uniref:NR LBD domain-containing protein n=1 Tax=Acrobeloides nanus TaxID=290746 RepID=A0A914CGW1_9BILA
MQKCKEVGMRLVEEDLQDEVGSHTTSTTSPITSPTAEHSSTDTSSLASSNPSGSPEKQPHIHYYTSANDSLSQTALINPAPRIEGKRLIYDCNPLIQAIKTILDQPAKSLYLTHGIHLSFMQQLQYAFTQFHTVVLPPPGTPVETITEFDTELMKFNETYISSLADMVMKCEHFAQLPLNDKYIMFKRFWPLFQGIERTFATSLLCGTSANDTRLLIADRFAIDIASKQFHVRGFPQESLDKLKPYMDPMLEKSSKFLMQPLKAMRVTAFEIAYLSAYILWTVHGITGLSETTVNMAEDIFEQCASELHNYYVYEMRLPNYAPRLAKLTKIVSAAEHTVHAKKDFSTMAKVFDIFD